MWTSFVNKQTKREYANYIFARQRLYANKYVPERNMNDWLREMQLLRNELLHYMKIISDEEFAEILLSNVAQTHREVVRQFSKHYDPGFQRNTPSSAQVMNALRAESELDERSDEPSGSQDISSAQSTKGSRDSALPERKRFQNKKTSGKSDGNARHVDMLSHQDSNSEIVTTQSAISNSVEWILDSASDCHVCTNKALLSNLRHDDGPLVFDWEGKPSRSRWQVGDPELRVRNENQPDTTELLQLSTVIYTATGTSNLLSLDKLEKDGWEFIKLRKQSWAWLRKGSVLLKLMKPRGRYRLQSTAAPVVQVEAAAQTRLGHKRALVRLHARLGHLNYGVLQQMVRDETVDGLKLSGSVNAPSERCWTCVQSRMKRMSYKRVHTARSTIPYQKLMSDMCDVGDLTYNGYKEFQLVQDEATRYVWGFIMKRKKEAIDVVTKHVAWLIAQGHKIEVFGADQGPELVNTKFEAYLRERGISLITTNTYSPEENGLVERMHGIVLSRIRSLLTTVDMPERLWGEAFQFAVEVLNVSPSYAKRSISYRLLDLRTGDIKELRTVEFAEDWTVDRSYVEKLLLNRYLRGKYRLPAKIPYVRLDKLTSPSPTTTLGSQNDDEHRNKRHCSQDLRTHIVVDAPPATGASVLPSVPISGVLSMNLTRTAQADARPSRARGRREYVPSQIQEPLMEEAAQKVARTCLTAVVLHRVNATDAVIANGDPVEGTPRSVGVGMERDDEEDVELGASFRRSTRIRRPNVRLSDYNVDIPASLVIQSGNELLEPTSVPEALSAPDALKWIEALDTEYQEQIRNNVWDFVDRPPGEKVLKNKSVFVKKRNAEGEIIRYRARITVKGCQQEFGVNFWETYAPVSKIESVRAILLLALYLGLNCRQVGFVTAFLIGPIGEAMKQPDYFDDGSGPCGFNRTKMDAGVDVRTAGANKVFITVYVDDLLIVGAGPNIEEVVAELKKEFKIKDLGNVKNLLGMEITYVRGRMLTISRKGYCEKVLKRFKMDKCKPVPTPQMEGNLPQPGDPEVEPVCVNADPDLDYRQMVFAFVAAAECSTMVMWTLNLFEELGLRRSKTTLYDDNQAAIAVIKANTGHFKVKGVDLKYHKVRDYFERGEFDLEYCPSEDNVADIFTKPLGPTQFKKLRQRLNVIPVPEINADMKTGQN
ncbi:unnamed protein product [Phytophthora fragariaefolia]|uniref:Unnamed protein product n=1 Tax=Phytophthora fragariaefolia TaxID=1490495 RepID=A0A9W6Y4R8_9STRA|nr:unnamed protein product [Phytophthora fragariaefolia]